MLILIVKARDEQGIRPVFLECYGKLSRDRPDAVIIEVGKGSFFGAICVF